MMKTLLSAAALSAAMLVPAAAQDTGPAYLVASLQISDMQAYMADYGGPVFPKLAAAGAEILVGSPQVDTLEGDYDANWTVVVRFPSMEALEGWYDSAEYQAIAPNRRSLTEEDVSFMLAAPAFVVPGQ